MSPVFRAPHEFARGIMQYLNREIPREEFEDWFVGASWNVHKWGARGLSDAVWEIEAALTRYHAHTITESQLREILVLIVERLRVQPS